MVAAVGEVRSAPTGSPSWPSAPQAPRRTTGEIPLSWAMPAETVSDDIVAPPTRPIVTVVLVVGLAIVAAATIAVVLAGRDTAVSERPPAATFAQPTPPTTAPEPVLPVRPAPAVLPVEAADTPPALADPSVKTTGLPTGPVGDAIKAQALLNRARLAARDGDDVKARLLAEQAVEADDVCGPCWKTLAFLRGRAGDRAGATIAKARVDALEQAKPLP